MRLFCRRAGFICRKQLSFLCFGSCWFCNWARRVAGHCNVNAAVVQDDKGVVQGKSVGKKL